MLEKKCSSGINKSNNTVSFFYENLESAGSNRSNSYLTVNASIKNSILKKVWTNRLDVFKFLGENTFTIIKFSVKHSRLRVNFILDLSESLVLSK